MLLYSILFQFNYMYIFVTYFSSTSFKFSFLIRLRLISWYIPNKELYAPLFSPLYVLYTPPILSEQKQKSTKLIIFNTFIRTWTTNITVRLCLGMKWLIDFSQNFQHILHPHYWIPTLVFRWNSSLDNRDLRQTKLTQWYWNPRVRHYQYTNHDLRHYYKLELVTST
jgi:hypothetical protein